jgi:hypothetical protein
VIDDDLHAAEGETVEAAATCTLILNGTGVDIDLTQQHIDELTKLLAPYFEHGRAVGADAPGLAPIAPGGHMQSRRYNAACRTWARKHGYPLDQASQKAGYIPVEVRKAFIAAGTPGA